jgi:hypothetical protein
MTRAGQAHQPVDKHLPLGHRPCVGGDRVIPGSSSRGSAGTSRSGLGAACRRSGSGYGS